MKNLLVAVHGFLGEPRDFQYVQKLISETSSDWQVWAPDLWRHPRLNPRLSMEDWGRELIREAQGFGQFENKVLLGYSMGGRLALHSVAASPDFWQRLIVISSHPGEGEDLSRRSQDLRWAARFLSAEKWTQLMIDWNQQSVFAGDPEPDREKQCEVRETLALALDNWSVSRQRDFREATDLSMPRTTLLTGEKDTKYSEIGSKWSLRQPKLNHQVVAGAGHRLLFSHPQAVVAAVVKRE